MADTIVGQYLEIKTYTHLDNQLGINVHHAFITSLPAGVISGQVAASQISAWLAAVIRPCISSEALYLGISLRQWSAGGPNWATVWSKTGQAVGLGGATPCPKQCTGIFSKVTPLGGAAGRGRTYVPFPSTSFVEPEGNPTDAYLDLMAAYAARVDGDENINADLTIKFGLMKWRNAASFIAISGTEVRDRFATQRRRGDYGRLNAIPPQLV